MSDTMETSYLVPGVTIAQHLINNIAVLVVLFLFDRILLSNILPIKKERNRVAA